jgi:hypothetical protein
MVYSPYFISIQMAKAVLEITSDQRMYLDIVRMLSVLAETHTDGD